MPREVRNRELGDKRNNLPYMKHCSEVQLVSACNCGRRQGTRRDPFDYKEANYMFYEQMTELCCFRWTRVALPENTRYISLDTGTEMADKFEKLHPYVDDDLSDQSEHGVESLSPGNLSLSQTKMLPRSRRMETSISSTEERVMEDQESVLSDSESCQSKSSTTSIAGAKSKEPESGVVHKSSFLGMFTQNENPRAMPRFPSWNLLDSGPYFSYTHSSGLEYSGFVHGSNFLLPWDVPLKTRINKVRKQRVKRGIILFHRDLWLIFRFQI